MILCAALLQTESNEQILYKAIILGALGGGCIWNFNLGLDQFVKSVGTFAIRIMGILFGPQKS